RPYRARGDPLPVRSSFPVPGRRPTVTDGALEHDLAWHADLDPPVRVRHTDLDGVHLVDALVARLNRRRGELGLRGDPDDLPGPSGQLAAIVDLHPDAAAQLDRCELVAGHVRSQRQGVEVGDPVERRSWLDELPPLDVGRQHRARHGVHDTAPGDAVLDLAYACLATSRLLADRAR